MRDLYRSTMRACGALLVLAAALPLRTADAREQCEATACGFYTLTHDATYSHGCFDGCTCPVTGHPMRGAFRLVFVGFDPLFTNYRVENFEALVPRPIDPLLLRGRGTFRIGGEVAVMQQMTLDVTAGGASFHYDSGLVPGGGGFPEIAIDLAANAFACFDTVLYVHARPATVGSGDPPAGAVQAVPNPFRSALELRFVQPAPGPLEATVFDARGRLARRLFSDAWGPAGPRALLWDGHLESGEAAPAGLYFARVRAAGHEWRERIVRIE